eukprot:1617822-Karenia_brevis.AAC.1
MRQQRKHGITIGQRNFTKIALRKQLQVIQECKTLAFIGSQIFGDVEQWIVFCVAQKMFFAPRL